jgi:hypothetical protein
MVPRWRLVFSVCIAFSVAWCPSGGWYSVYSILSHMVPQWRLV